MDMKRKRNFLYSPDDIKLSYEKVGSHRQSRGTILKYSKNPIDVRTIALSGLDLSSVKNVLDLGCGYGFFSEALAAVLGSAVHIAGIDLVESNRAPFMDTLASLGVPGEFMCGSTDLIRTMESGRFDLIIASYSLYFFPHLIPEIARACRPGGVFIAITHSRFTMKEILGFIPACMKEVGIKPPSELMIRKLFKSFSSENGLSLLEPYFDHVERIIFRNELIVPPDEVSQFISYLDGKEYLMLKDVRDIYPTKIDQVKECFYRKVYESAKIMKGDMIITKHDSVFRCFHQKKEGLSR